MSEGRAILALIAVFFVVGILAAGCGGTDASVSSRDHGAAKAIINMPNHFNNVSVKCYGTTGIYVTNNNGNGGTGSALAVLANDPACHG